MKKNIRFDVQATMTYISDLHLEMRYLLIYKVRRFHIYVWLDRFDLSIKQDNSLTFAIPTAKNMRGKYKHSSIEYIRNSNGELQAFIPNNVHSIYRYHYSMVYFLNNTDKNMYLRDVVRFYMI